MKTNSNVLLNAAAMSLLLVNQLWGQISGGSIVGSVLDSSGAAIVGVKVTATNVATNEVSGTVTNDTGYFEFPLLPAGRYVLALNCASWLRPDHRGRRRRIEDRPLFHLESRQR